MSIKISLKDTVLFSKIATATIFLALIRCVTEPFRLQHYSATMLNFHDLEPFLIGSLITASGLFVMTILAYFGKHKMVIATCVLIVVVLLVIKDHYLIP